MALLTALFVSALSIGLGLSLVLLSSVEATLAGHDREARALAAAARAASAIAVSDLRALPSWTSVARPGAVPELSASPGRFVDATLSPPAPWGGGTLDLRSLTAQLQAESDASTPAGVPHPQWRLFVYGSLSSAMVVPAPPWYLAAWVADDRGVLLVRAAALARGEARAEVEMSAVRVPAEGGDAVRILSVRTGS